MKIRHAKIEDLPAIAKLSGDLGYSNDEDTISKRFMKISSDSKHAIFVAESNAGGIAGWLHVMPRILLLSRPLAEIGGLIVAEEYRRKGVGKHLMDFAEVWAKGQHHCPVLHTAGGIASFLPPDRI